MSAEELPTKPDPIARQSDLDIMRAEQKNEHLKTRAIVVIFNIPSVLRAVPYVLGAVELVHWLW